MLLKRVVYLPSADDHDVTFQKIHFEVVLLKDEMKTQDYRIADYPFSCISTLYLWTEKIE